MPREILVGILLAAMLAKATLIAANFMHLKYEKLSVGIAVGVSLLFVGAILFLLMVPDGLRMLRMGG
jgi:cytochrome c oxidase subunit IV